MYDSMTVSGSAGSRYSTTVSWRSCRQEDEPGDQSAVAGWMEVMGTGYSTTVSCRQEHEPGHQSAVAGWMEVMGDRVQHHGQLAQLTFSQQGSGLQGKIGDMYRTGNVTRGRINQHTLDRVEQEPKYHLGLK